MRSVRIQINDESYTVSLEERGKDRYSAILDGNMFEAETTSQGNITSWLVRSGTENLHAKAMNRPNDRVDVWLGCMPFPATVQPIGLGGYPVSAEARTKSMGGGQIRALMPGRITSILVKEDEEVNEGTPLLILEAMKMQNEIAAPNRGRVKMIYVHQGESVKKDAVLLSME